MLLEADLIPFHLSQPPGKKALILAPHPDDETLGCGGAISLLAAAKKDIKVVFLTSGDKADPANKLSHKKSRRPSLVKGVADGFSDAAHITDYSLLREKEAEKALNVFGVYDYEFLRFPDRGLNENSREVFARLLEIFRDYQPDAVYCPSMIELHPDHRTASGLAIRLQKAMDSAAPGTVPFSLVFYEVTTPLRPNLLVDITAVYGKKMKALGNYRSQLKLLNYSGHIEALNKVRTLTVNPAGKQGWRPFSNRLNSCEYAEAFWLADRPLTDEDIIKWLGFREGISTK